jgi:protocatechuate 3,4-dioxygenase, beta subunit
MLEATPQIVDDHQHHSVSTAFPSTGFTRRGMLTASALITGAGLVGVTAPAFGQQAGVRPTPEEIMGPFYPLRLPADQDADLTIIAGKEGRALGQVLYLSGRVTNLRGEPVVGAELEIWQANAAGRYNHLADDNQAPIDPNFDGYARIRTGPDGSYSIKTIKPGAYPATPNWMRPPHIHFDIKGRSSRLVTQMYLEGEALNEKDILLQRKPEPARKRLIASYGAPSGKQETNALVAVWNIVLISG